MVKCSLFILLSFDVYVSLSDSCVNYLRDFEKKKLKVELNIQVDMSEML